MSTRRAGITACEHRCYTCYPDDLRDAHYGPALQARPWDLVGVDGMTEEQAYAYHQAAGILDASPLLAHAGQLDRLRLAAAVARQVIA